jgi:hypothetical protein
MSFSRHWVLSRSFNMADDIRDQPFPFSHFPIPKKTKKIRDARVTMVAPDARSA